MFIKMANYELIDKELTYEFCKPFFRYCSIYFPVTFCKYYNKGEKRIPKIPDILDTIDKELDRLEDCIDKHTTCAVSREVVYNKVDSNFTPKMLKEAISRLETLRDEVTDGSDIWYTFHKPSTYTWAGEDAETALNTYSTCVTPIKAIKMKQLYRPMFDPKTETWQAVPDDRDEPKYGVLIDEQPFYNRVYRKGEWRAIPFQIDVWELYESFYEVAIAETPEQISLLDSANVKWINCEKCGKLFYLPLWKENKQGNLCKNCLRVKK